MLLLPSTVRSGSAQSSPPEVLLRPPCKKASKAHSQRRWRESDKGLDYFRGSANVHRVKAWRRAHPGYARNRGKPSRALQDDSPSQVLCPQEDKSTLSPRALQEMILAQGILLTGVIAHCTGSALQENIASAIQRLLRLGQQIQGPVAGVSYGDLKASALQGTPAASPPAIQLDRPPPGP